METTRAILLRKIRFSETSLIVTWFTESCGKLKTMAKGARSAKSKFAGRLDLFFEVELQFARSKKSELHSLREAELRDSHEGLRQNYARTELAAYWVELIELTTELEYPAPELFDLLKRAFTHLAANAPTQRALLHFEAELVRLLGIANREVSPAIAIGRVYGRLPEVRKALLKKLK